MFLRTVGEYGPRPFTSVYMYIEKLGELIIFQPWREKLSFLPTELDNLIYGKTMYVFYLSFKFGEIDKEFFSELLVNTAPGLLLWCTCI